MQQFYCNECLFGDLDDILTISRWNIASFILTSLSSRCGAKENTNKVTAKLSLLGNISIFAVFYSVRQM